MRNTYENTPLVIRLHNKCGHTQSGHDVFYLRAKVTLERSEWLPVSNLRMDGEWVEFDAGDKHFRGWNHNSELIAQVIAVDPTAQWEDSSSFGGLLRLPTEGGFHIFNLGFKRTVEGCAR